MLKFVRVMAGGADANYEQHLSGVQTVFCKAFSFHPTYTEKLADYAAGHHPEGAEVIILAALDVKDNVIGFTTTFFFADLKTAYLDYLASDPARAFYVTVDGMRRIGAEIGALKVPTLIVQEGGYNLSNLRRGVRAFILSAAGAKIAQCLIPNCADNDSFSAASSVKSP